MNKNILIGAIGVLLLLLLFLYYKINKDIVLQKQQINEFSSKLLGLEKYIIDNSLTNTNLMTKPSNVNSKINEQCNIHNTPKSKELKKSKQTPENSITKQYNSFVN